MRTSDPFPEQTRGPASPAQNRAWPVLNRVLLFSYVPACDRLAEMLCSLRIRLEVEIFFLKGAFRIAREHRFQNIVHRVSVIIESPMAA
jgi:hypothetical protein